MGQVVIEPQSHDFGVIDEFSQRLAEFDISNQSADTVYILRIDVPPEANMKISSKIIAPETTERIRIRYNPYEKGNFKVEMPLYLSSSLEATTLVMKGDAEHVQFTDVACPDFSQPAKSREYAFRIEVKDAQTGEPVKRASLAILYRSDVDRAKTDRDGYYVTEHEPGRHYLEVRADGYRGIDTAYYPTPQRNTLEVFLPRDESEYIAGEVDVPEPGVIERSDDTAISAPRTQINDPNPDFSLQEFRPNNIVFLVDVSGSMKHKGKLDLLKLAMTDLLEMLRPVDQLAVVTYAGEANVLLPPQPIGDKNKWEDAIQSLEAKGYTRGDKGVELACETAIDGMIDGGNNEVFLATDGAFNKDTRKVDRIARRYARKGVKVSVLGIKNSSWTEESMRALAKEGNGNYLKIEEIDGATEILRNEVRKQSRR